MKTLLYKELRLTAHPTSVVFAFLGCLVLVPAYPYSVIFLFGCLAPYITLVNARETNDLWYTATLPMTKRESVLSKCLLTATFQLFQLAFSVPFACLRAVLAVPNNPVGLDATAAWYGFGLMLYAVFDLVFLSSYFKSGYRVGRAFLLASVPMALGMAAGSLGFPFAAKAFGLENGRHWLAVGAALAGAFCLWKLGPAKKSQNAG